MFAIRSLALGLATICAVVVLFSCRRLLDLKQPDLKQPPQARNLTPGLSEELTAFARRHRRQMLFLVDQSGNNEEARNFADLIAKAFEAGGWTVIRPDVSANPGHGLYCSYNPELQQKEADDLLSVFQRNGLRIECGPRPDSEPVPLFSLTVGLNR